MGSAEDYLRNRIRDLADQAFSRGIYTCSGFLTPLEQDLYLGMRQELPVKSELLGGHEAAIRRLIRFGSETELGYPFESPIRVLHVRPKAEKFASECSHRDYLGAMLALGIDRKLTGDILVRGKEAWIFALESVCPYLIGNLTSVGRTQTVCELCGPDVPVIEPQFRELSVNIASERLDLILGAAAGIKREDAKKLLAADKVFVNGRLAVSPGQKLRAGDELVIRGFGKYLFDGAGGTTKKGRQIVVLRKYL